jgi:hypothetical protein
MQELAGEPASIARIGALDTLLVRPPELLVPIWSKACLPKAILVPNINWELFTPSGRRASQTLMTRRTGQPAHWRPR